MQSVVTDETFSKNDHCVNGWEQTCKRCRTEKKKLQEAFRKSEARREKDGVTTKVRTAPIEPPSLPPGVTIDPVSGSDDFPLTRDFICNCDSSITIDFSYHPDLLKSVLDAAKREFRTPQMQILYMLSKYNEG